MNQKEYFKISDDNKLPRRCPILNYCKRRAWTIYFSSYKNATSGDVIQFLLEEKELPNDFIDKAINLQGEEPGIISGKDNGCFNHFCPEVPLFDSAHGMFGFKGTACSSGEWDDLQKPSCKPLEFKHFSECAEFSFYMFNQGKPKKIQRKKRPAIPPKIKAKLQQEIHSRCPFCRNNDVGHFEIHHIDGNPSNNEFSNLLMLCPTCHSKIEKGDIFEYDVSVMKKYVGFYNTGVEVYNISIDSQKCSWRSHATIKYAFFQEEDESKSPFPILQFHLINHFDKTIVLQSVELVVKHLYSGMSGLPEPREVPKGKVERIIVKFDREVQSIDNFSGVQIPSEQAYIFQLELLEEALEGEIGFLVPENRQILEFTLKFSNDVVLKLPKILFNTENEKEGVPIYILS